MPRAIALRSDVTAAQLRNLARRGKDAAQARRLLALAAIYDGGSRGEAARLGDVTLQIVTKTGCCASTPRGRTGCATARRLDRRRC